jgi:hypothetical protein
MAVIKIVPMPGVAVVGPQGPKGDTGNTGPQGPAGNNGTNGADGSPGLVYLGDYVSGNGYIANIAVVKGADNNLYIAKASGGLLSPVANPLQWDIFIPKGEDGADGTNGADGADALWNFTGPWVNGIDYGPGSVVEFEGSTYYHPNGQFSSYAPPANGWLLVSAKGADAELPTGATGTFQTSDSKIVSVVNGIITSIESLT